MIRLLLAALCAVLFVSSADARRRQHHRTPDPDPFSQFFAGVFDPPPQASRAARRKGHRGTLSPGLRRVMAEGAGRVVSHPAGCPRRAFCGCGASVRVFGRPVRSLWLAANWFRFPRTSPAPGTVAVRRHHVFVLERHIRGSTWMVYDANSGRHRTRVHPRSIAGWAIVDPRGV